MSAALLSETVRNLAMALPHAEENAHMGKTDFRVKNKIFATCPDANTLRIKLLPEQQSLYTETQPDCVAPVSGGWGRQGWTSINIDKSNTELLQQLLELAWRNVAQKRMIAAFDAGTDAKTNESDKS